jgi:tRNA 5-methylaminomethyl-2-thiouridine biosynthesis bifunctional protein
VGASYQPVSAREAEWPDDKNHGANALRLEKLAPDVFAALAGELEAGALQAWKGQRFVTADRLPLLGPVAPTVSDVWTCAGFGSRGLSLVAVCAELLAAQWAFEPWPVEASLAQAMIPYRKCL